MLTRAVMSVGEPLILIRSPFGVLYGVFHPRCKSTKHSDCRQFNGPFTTVNVDTGLAMRANTLHRLKLAFDRGEQMIHEGNCQDYVVVDRVGHPIKRSELSWSWYEGRETAT